MSLFFSILGHIAPLLFFLSDMPRNRKKKPPVFNLWHLMSAYKERHVTAWSFTQFLRDQASDSEEVVTPLMLDGTYLTLRRNSKGASR